MREYSLIDPKEVLRRVLAEYHILFTRQSAYLKNMGISDTLGGTKICDFSYFDYFSASTTKKLTNPIYRDSTLVYKVRKIDRQFLNFLMELKEPFYDRMIYTSLLALYPYYQRDIPEDKKDYDKITVEEHEKIIKGDEIKLVFNASKDNFTDHLTTGIDYFLKNINQFNFEIPRKVDNTSIVRYLLFHLLHMFDYQVLLALKNLGKKDIFIALYKNSRRVEEKIRERETSLINNCGNNWQGIQNTDCAN